MHIADNEDGARKDAGEGEGEGDTGFAAFLRVFLLRLDLTSGCRLDLCLELPLDLLSGTIVGTPSISASCQVVAVSSACSWGDRPNRRIGLQTVWAKAPYECKGFVSVKFCSMLQGDTTPYKCEN
eukprot:1191111-Amorphochlora_amoeboformis.AAC.1